MKFNCFIALLVLTVCSCNMKGENDEKNKSSEIERQSEIQVQKELTVDQKNDYILQSYVSGTFVVNNLFYDSPILYHKNGVISTLHLVNKETNNKRSILTDESNKVLLNFFETGKLKSRSELLGRKKHGTWENYFDNGQLARSVNYINGMQEGEEIYFYSSGKIQMKSFFLSGKRHGEFYQGFENGSIKSKAIYNKGIKVGEASSFYESGSLEEKCEDHADFRTCTTYYENGKLKSESKLNLIDGNIFSIIYYDENGVVTESNNYDASGNKIKSSSLVETYDKNGNINNN